MGKPAVAVGLLERAYDLTLDDSEWLSALADHMLPELDQGLGVVAWTYGPTPSGPRVLQVEAVGQAVEYRHLPEQQLASTPLELLSQSWVGDQLPARTLAGDHPVESEAYRQVTACYPPELVDLLALQGASPDGYAVALAAPSTSVIAAVPARLRKLAKLAVHLAAGMRLRQGLRDLAGDLGSAPAAEAVLSPSGSIVHAEGDAKTAGARELLSSVVREIDGVRANPTSDEAVLEVWRGLVDGRWSLVDHFQADGRRFIVAVRNPADLPDPRALTLRERQVAGLVALGYPTKLIAYALGLSMGTVSGHLDGVLRKLRVPNRVALVRLLHQFDAPHELPSEDDAADV